MNYKRINEEVYYAVDSIVQVTAKDIEYLKAQAAQTARKRVRLCCHADTQDALHEMLIIHAKGAYIAPHQHQGKTESFHIIEGEIDVIVFDDHGDIIDVIQMGPYGSNLKFYYRLPPGRFHTLIPRSVYVVFHETTNGPFNKEEAIFAAWAPHDSDLKKAAIYLQDLEASIKQFNAKDLP